MKVSVRDRDFLKSIQPLELAAYLRASGWHEESKLSEYASIWVFEKGSEDEYELILPLTRDVGDFATRMSEVLQTLEITEQRSQLEILKDLSTPTADVVSVKLDHSENDDGSILVDEGVSLIKGVREMLLSAACAAVTPKPQFQTRKPQRAMDYLSRVRLGQTERGSFIVNLISPVTPNLSQPELLPQDPFERTVVKTLAEALEATQNAAERSAITGDMDPFSQAIVKGVSANLCESIVGIYKSGGSEGVEVNLRWAQSRPVSHDLPKKVLFSPDSVPIIEEAGRLFRETSPQEGFEVEGYVVKLVRESDEKGTVTIASFVEGSPRKVNVSLYEQDHVSAIRAYEEGIRVLCYGDLVKQGGTFVLLNPYGFALEPDE